MPANGTKSSPQTYICHSVATACR